MYSICLSISRACLSVSRGIFGGVLKSICPYDILFGVNVQCFFDFFSRKYVNYIFSTSYTPSQSCLECLGTAISPFLQYPAFLMQFSPRYRLFISSATIYTPGQVFPVSRTLSQYCIPILSRISLVSAMYFLPFAIPVQISIPLALVHGSSSF